MPKRKGPVIVTYHAVSRYLQRKFGLPYRSKIPNRLLAEQMAANIGFTVEQLQELFSEALDSFRGESGVVHLDRNLVAVLRNGIVVTIRPAGEDE